MAESQTHASGELFCLSQAANGAQARLFRSPGCFHITSSVITQADPVVFVSGQLLSALHPLPGEPPLQFTSLTCAGLECPIGDVIQITDAAGRRVIYVITAPVSTDWQVYEARWPD